MISVKKNGLDIERCLKSDSRYSINIFGIASHKMSWRYKMIVSTPALDTFMWLQGLMVRAMLGGTDYFPPEPVSMMAMRIRERNLIKSSAIEDMLKDAGPADA